MIILIIILFIAGYLLIAMEQSIRINKASIALLLGTLLWIIYLYIAPDIVPQVAPDQFRHYLDLNPALQSYSYKEQIRDFVVNFQILESLGDIGETILFLLAAMTIVEIIDVHGGFTYITDHITTRHKRRLLWLIGFITFFMSAVLDNLTITIIMLMLVRRIIPDPRERWLFGGIIVIAANSGGAWSPIGDVTTIMLWTKGNVTYKIIPQLFLPSLVSMAIPTFVAQFFFHGKIKDNPEKTNPHPQKKPQNYMSSSDRLAILIFGLLILVLSPVFKAITNLPPFIWLLFGVSLMWIYTEIIYNYKVTIDEKNKVRVSKVFKRLDFSTLMFFLGILLAVDALQKAGILGSASEFLAQKVPNIYEQGILIGLLSSVVDNVPLVAAAIGMYPLVDPATLSTFADPAFMQNFVPDGIFWHFIAYCAGVGGNILIIGSAAGVVFMGIEGVSFGWYLKRMTPIALIGYLAGAGIYILQHMLIV